MSLETKEPLTTGEAALPAQAPKRSQSENLVLIRQVWPWVFFILLVIAFTIASQQMNSVNFISYRSVQGILEYCTQILLIGLGETFIIITAGIDLSAGWILGFSSVIAAQIMKALNGAGYPPLTSIGLGMAGGILITIIPGLLNGILIARVKVPSFISTLGVGILFEGIALIRSEGYPIAQQPAALGPLGNGYLMYYWPGHGTSFLTLPAEATNVDLKSIIPIMPNMVMVAILVTIICWFILAKTQFGQHLYAIGGNFEASMRAGIPVQRTLIKVYILAAVLAGIAGVIWAARFTSGAYNAGEVTPMMSIAAVVIGGASLFGGEGRIIGTIVGALIIATIQYGLVVLGITAFWQYVAVGLVLIVAVIVDQFGRNLGK